MSVIALILLVALLIPIMGIVVDSPIGRALARRLEGPQDIPPGLSELAKKVDLLEAEVDDLARSVQTLPRKKKSRHLVNLGAVSEMVAARLLVAYHLHHQRGMMGAFLDALGITHENGLIADEELQPPSADRLREAARAIGAAFPTEDVALYLSTLMWQDPETWAGLSELPELAQHA